MSALTLDEIAALPLNGSIWNLAALPEFPECTSRRYRMTDTGVLVDRCCVLHAETGDSAHSVIVNGHSVFWTDAEAEQSRLAYLGLPSCANCRGRYLRSDCGPYCSARCRLADKHTFDEYETEAAA
jgi:hypothetical protein